MSNQDIIDAFANGRRPAQVNVCDARGHVAPFIGKVHRHADATTGDYVGVSIVNGGNPLVISFDALDSILLLDTSETLIPNLPLKPTTTGAVVFAEMNRILDCYDISEDNASPQCAPEDVWRLYADLYDLTGRSRAGDPE